jgi:hypothetical protein
MIKNFSDLFPGEQFGKYQARKTGNKTQIGRRKVIALLERSKSLFLDDGYTYQKNGQAKKPLACFAKESEDRYSVRAIYARTTVPMPNGYDCIYCPADRVPTVHDLLISAIQSGAFDDQITKIQSQLSKQLINKE